MGPLQFSASCHLRRAFWSIPAMPADDDVTSSSRLSNSGSTFLRVTPSRIWSKRSPRESAAAGLAFGTSPTWRKVLPLWKKKRIEACLKKERTKAAWFCKEGSAAKWRSGLVCSRFETRCQQGLYTPLKSIFYLAICTSYIMCETYSWTTYFYTLALHGRYVTWAH